MAQDEHGGELRTAHSSDRSVSSGAAILADSEFTNPGLPDHHERVTDTDPKKEKNAERVITVLFWVSLASALFATVAYFAWPIDRNDITSVRGNNFFLGLGIALSMLTLGIGTVAWAKYLMKDKEMAEARHPIAASPATRQRVSEIFAQADEESGFSRRKMLRNSLIGALVALPLPGIVMLRDFYNANNEKPVKLLHQTLWGEGVRLVRDPSGTPIKWADVTIGSAFHVIPETLIELEENHDPNFLNEKAKAVVLLMRLPEERLKIDPARKDWSVQRHRRLLEGLHPRWLPRGALRTADAPPAVPVPPVAVRCHRALQGDLRPRWPPATAAADRGRRRGLPHRHQRLPRTCWTDFLGASS